MLTAENAMAIAALCVQLDGLPLAIELAAAQCRYFTPQELAIRLVRQNPARLKFLEHGWRNLPLRHQTLLAAIDWSYRLLEPDEQMLFARLGVFVGGFDPAAGEAVYANLLLDAGAEQIVNGQTANGTQRETGNTLAGIASLVDKNLVRRIETTGGEARFSMLETLREYALEQLRQRGELEVVRRRQAEFFLALAEVAEPKLLSKRYGLRAWKENGVILIAYWPGRSTRATLQRFRAQARYRIRNSACGYASPCGGSGAIVVIWRKVIIGPNAPCSPTRTAPTPHPAGCVPRRYGV
jgi:predicted ATPase